MAPPAAITFENLRLERRTLLGIVDEQQVLDATFARSVRGITTTAIAELAEVVGPRLFAAQLGAPIYAEPTDDQLFGHAELANWRSLRASYALAQQHARAAGEAVKEARTRYGAHSPFGLFSRMVKDETFARKSQQLKREAVAKELEFDEATEKVRGIADALQGMLTQMLVGLLAPDRLDALCAVDSAAKSTVQRHTASLHQAEATFIAAQNRQLKLAEQSLSNISRAYR